MTIDRNDELELRSIIQDELKNFFDPKHNPIMVDQQLHYDHHRKLEDGCMASHSEQEAREEDHKLVRSIRKAIGEVQHRTIVNAGKFVVLLGLFAIIFAWFPAKIYITKAIEYFTK